MRRIYTNPSNYNLGHKPDLSIYRDVPKAQNIEISIQTPFIGDVPLNEYDLESETYETNEYTIPATTYGDEGPLVLFLHGVPTNRYEFIEIQKLLSPFCRTVSIDMLGMGDSDKPLNYGRALSANTNVINENANPWDWINDVDYIDQVMNELYPNEKFIFVASDWGGGIATKYAEKLSQRLYALILLDPVALDGYPVSEIQAIGRASRLDNTAFGMQMGAIDQTMVQILKSMVYNPYLWNQYNLRDIKKTYIDTDYERSEPIEGEDADSITLRLKYNNVRVLADRAAVLSPAQLVPINENPRGVDYTAINIPVCIVWGEQDNMMPANQAYRLMNLLTNSPSIQIQMVTNAGHLVELDRPDRVGEIILNFIYGDLRLELADPFLGFTGIWKGDEDLLIKELRKKQYQQVRVNEPNGGCPLRSAANRLPSTTISNQNNSRLITNNPRPKYPTIRSSAVRTPNLIPRTSNIRSVINNS